MILCDPERLIGFLEKETYCIIAKYGYLYSLTIAICTIFVQAQLEKPGTQVWLIIHSGLLCSVRHYVKGLTRLCTLYSHAVDSRLFEL